MQVHITRGGKQEGPYSWEQVGVMLEKGQLASHDLYWTDGMANWTPLAQLAGKAGAPLASAQPMVTYQYGGFWIRFVAFILDNFIISIPFGILFYLMMPSAEQFMRDPEAFARSPAFMLLQFGPMVAFFVYEILMTSSSMQGTLGKMALGLKVIDDRGRRLSFGRATGRAFAKYLALLILCIGVIMVAFTARKQGLHDSIVSTLVVKK